MEHTEYFLTPNEYTANMTQIGWYYWEYGRFPVYYETPEYRASLDAYEARRGPYRGPGVRDIDAECDAVQLRRELLEGKE